MKYLIYFLCYALFNMLFTIWRNGYVDMHGFLVKCCIAAISVAIIAIGKFVIDGISLYNLKLKLKLYRIGYDPDGYLGRKWYIAAKYPWQKRWRFHRGYFPTFDGAKWQLENKFFDPVHLAFD